MPNYILDMAQPSLRQFKPTPPDKGSFPLDHDGECKVFYLKFMVCLSKNDNSNSKCRVETKDYLNCRMEKGLMKISHQQQLICIYLCKKKVAKET